MPQRLVSTGARLPVPVCPGLGDVDGGAARRALVERRRAHQEKTAERKREEQGGTESSRTHEYSGVGWRPEIAPDAHERQPAGDENALWAVSLRALHPAGPIRRGDRFSSYLTLILRLAAVASFTRAAIPAKSSDATFRPG